MLNTAKEAALAAGRILIYNLKRNILIMHKGKDDLVSEIDWKAERKVISIIKQKYPDHAFECEEHGHIGPKSKYLWLVDALDGTVNYVHDIAPFCVSLGLLKDDKPYIGVVYNPIRNELFWAQKGKGAFLNGKRIHVSRLSKISDAMLCSDITTHKEYHDEFFHILSRISPKIMGIRVLNDTSLLLSHVAAGRFDMYMKNKMPYYDVAPGALIIQEAGGKVTTFDGKPIGPNMKNVVASNGKLHATLKKLVQL